MTLIDSLTLRYQAVFETKTDRDFYIALHHYFDLVLKTPELETLIDASQREYAEKHSAIWGTEKAKTEKELDDKEARTLRLERFNLYCRMATIYVRIYLPIEDYKNSTEPEDMQHPAALLMMHGTKLKSKRYSKETLRGHRWWFEGKRGYYENELRKFHMLLVDALEKAEPVKEPERSGCPLFLDEYTGDWTLGDARGNLAPTSQAFKVLWKLYTSPRYFCDYLWLLQTVYPHFTEATKTKMSYLYPILKDIRKALGKELIQNVPKRGYRLYFKDFAETSETT